MNKNIKKIPNYFDIFLLIKLIILPIINPIRETTKYHKEWINADSLYHINILGIKTNELITGYKNLILLLEIILKIVDKSKVVNNIIITIAIASVGPQNIG